MAELFKKECIRFGKEFYLDRSKHNQGRGKFCTRQCAGKYLEPIETRIWNYVDRTQDPNVCWEFNGARRHGYGTIVTTTGKEERAHRVMYRLTKGDIPKGMLIMHTCDNRPCCNPNHLQLGTYKDNNQDMANKGRCRGVFQGGVKNKNSKLTIEQVNKIRSISDKDETFDIKEMSKEYNVSISVIRNVMAYNTYT